MKPRANITVTVSTRVTPELKQRLLDGAEQHQMSLCEYLALLVALSAGRHEELDQLRRDQMGQQLQLEESQQHLAQQQQKFAWYQGAIEEQLTGVLRNLDCLRDLYAQFGRAAVPVADALQRGFQPAFLLTSLLIDGQPFYAVGEYAWRYQTAQHTHLLILPHGRSIS